MKAVTYRRMKPVLLLVLLAALLLSACGSPAAQEGTPTPSGNNAIPTAGPEDAYPGTPGSADPAAPGYPGAGEPVGSGSPATLNVMTHDSFSASEEVIRQFEQQNNVRINFIKSGDAGSTLNRAILSKNAPLADVLYGVDNTFLSRGLDADIFLPYPSPELANIPDQFKLDPQNRALPVDFGDVCINYDKGYFASNNLAVPQTLDDLLKPEYRGLLVVESPATSSPGLAFLLATIAQYGPEGYIDYWKQLRVNGVVVVNDWETAYYTNFSGSSGRGQQPMVVSYASSPVAEVVFADNPPDEAPTDSIIGPNTCFRQVEFVGILRGTQQEALAQRFVDFMLSQPFQEDLPLQMFVYPVNQQAELPEPFQQFAVLPEQPARLDPAQIAANRETWINEWDAAVLR